MEGKHPLWRHEFACRQYLRSLDLVVDWRELTSVWQLCEVLAAHRRRPIHVEARDYSPPMVSLWIGTAWRDYIFYAAEAPPLLQKHGVLHEVAHMLLVGPPGGPSHGLGVPHARHDLVDWEEAPSPSPITLRHMLTPLRRVCYEDEHECTAEMLATLIEQRWRAVRGSDLDLPGQASTRLDIRWLIDHFVM